MGTTSSKNSVDLIVKAGIQVLNDTTQECSQVGRATQSITVIGSNDVNISNLDWTQMVTINQNCLSSSSVSSELSQDVSIAMQQATESILKGFVTLSSNEAENIMNLALDVSQEVVTSFAQVCSSDIATEQFIKIMDSDRQEYHYMNWTQIVTGISDCVQNAVADTLAAQRLQIELDQLAKASTTGLIASLAGPLTIIAIVALLFVMAPLLGGAAVITSVLTNKAFIAGAVVVVLVLIYMSAKDKNRDGDEDEDEDE